MLENLPPNHHMAQMPMAATVGAFDRKVGQERQRLGWQPDGLALRHAPCGERYTPQSAEFDNATWRPGALHDSPGKNGTLDRGLVSPR